MAVALNKAIHPELVAPCGINCAVCRHYLAFISKVPRTKGVVYCQGCRPQDKRCSLMRPVCRRTLKLTESEIDYCCDCNSYPCEKLSNLDKRYREHYGMSVIENLEEIRALGLAEFLAAQTKKYTCPQCGGIICVHDRRCCSCGRLVEEMH